MDVKKHGLSEQLSPKGKVFSRLAWGLVASLIVITGLFLTNSLKNPVVGSLFQGSYSVSNATVSLHSSLPSTPPVSIGNATEELQQKQKQKQKPLVAERKEMGTENAAKGIEKQGFWGEGEEDDDVDLEDGVDIEGTQNEELDFGAKSGNLGVEEEEARIQQIAQDGNGSVVPETGSGKLQVILEKTQNLSETVNNGALVGENVDADKAIEGEFANPNVTTESSNVGNLSNNGEVAGLSVGEEKAMELNDQGNLVETCDCFDGRWVKDDHYKPYYRPGSCPYIDKDFNCQRNGRPDNGYIKWSGGAGASGS